MDKMTFVKLQKMEMEKIYWKNLFLQDKKPKEVDKYEKIINDELDKLVLSLV